MRGSNGKGETNGPNTKKASAKADASNARQPTRLASANSIRRRGVAATAGLRTTIELTAIAAAAAAMATTTTPFAPTLTIRTVARIAFGRTVAFSSRAGSLTLAVARTTIETTTTAAAAGVAPLAIAPVAPTTIVRAAAVATRRGTRRGFGRIGGGRTAAKKSLQPTDKTTLLGRRSGSRRSGSGRTSGRKRAGRRRERLAGPWTTPPLRARIAVVPRRTAFPGVAFVAKFATRLAAARIGGSAVTRSLGTEDRTVFPAGTRATAFGTGTFLFPPGGRTFGLGRRQDGEAGFFYWSSRSFRSVDGLRCRLRHGGGSNRAHFGSHWGNGGGFRHHGSRTGRLGSDGFNAGHDRLGGGNRLRRGSAERVLVFTLGHDHLHGRRLVVAARRGGGCGSGRHMAAFAAREAGTASGAERSGNRRGRRAGGLGGSCSQRRRRFLTGRCRI